MLEPNVILGLGANLGDPAANLARALERLAGVLQLHAVSSVYRSSPVGYAAQPDFFNAVCIASTRLAPLALLRAVQAVEHQVGRVAAFRNGPRSIDVDVLDYAGMILETDALKLPHPAMHERGFVLYPLREVAPAWRHPVLGRTAAELLETAPHAAGVVRVGRLGEPSLAPSTEEG